MLEKNQLHTVELTGYTAGGLSIARINGQVVFIHGGVQGEVCVIRILKVLKNTAFARVEEILQRSADRQDPGCPHYPACGGCDFRHVSYAGELAAKRQRVQDALHRIGGTDLEPEEILGCAETDGYRNKCQFPVSAAGELGFFRARSHQVVPALDCRLQTPQANAIASAVQEYLRVYQVPAYNEKTGKGLLRHLYVRTNRRGQALVCLVVNGGTLPEEAALTERIRTACPETVGIVLGKNTAATNVVLGNTFRTVWGSSFLEDTLCGYTFRLSVPSFYQVNRNQAERLYEKAAEFAGLTGRERVLDLYCGIGTISLVMARNAKQVLGVEVAAEAVLDAKENARRNNITNVSFRQGDAADAAGFGWVPDVVVVDPPRKGLSPETVQAVASMEPERIVYVSCDPGTLARDVARFRELRYQAVRCVAVDMFPRTQHIETIVCLGRELDRVSQHIYLDYEPSPDMKIPRNPTYPEIKAWVLENHGLKVSPLYISQIKRKHGLPADESYNKPKSEDAKASPQCPPEKEVAIEAALRHFGLIPEN
ncbi:MAG: 23S rRNA (uracil(1939)-C(5))-methyltransferase RlmD [Oscillospiraceae bacterium]|nr:23S rRNA (uracil(1939)-C(5))-methyltransferase RlmD [Oscillospiraceae bacterium]